MVFFLSIDKENHINVFNGDYSLSEAFSVILPGSVLYALEQTTHKELKVILYREKPEKQRRILNAKSVLPIEKTTTTTPNNYEVPF